MAVPYYTLNEQGQPVALYDDGTVLPLAVTQGGADAGATTTGAGGPGEHGGAVRPVPGGAGLPGGDAAARRGAQPAEPPPYAGLATNNPIPPPVPSPGGTGGYGGGGGIDVRSRLAAARARVQGALGGGGSGYGGDAAPTPRVDGADRLHGRYARGLDPAQAAGLTLRPTAMLPRVFGNLTPADPTYNRLAALPVGQWASILGKGTPQSTANTVGKLYERAGERGAIPSTDRLLRNLQQGRGLEDAFQGVKSGPNDYDSFAQPGYVAGQEPMPMGEAAYTYGGLLDAALSSEPLLTAQKYGYESGGWGSYLVDKWASKALKKPPGKGTPVYKSVGRRLFR